MVYSVKNVNKIFMISEVQMFKQKAYRISLKKLQDEYFEYLKSQKVAQK